MLEGKNVVAGATPRLHPIHHQTWETLFRQMLGAPVTPRSPARRSS